jgi:hypothetical protein
VRRLVVIATALIAAGSATAAPPPSLSVVGSAPLVVAGTNFRAGERVTVTAAGTVRRTVARKGSFRLVLGDVRFGRCAGARIEAVGSLGSRVVSKIPRPACMPAAQP